MKEVTDFLTKALSRDDLKLLITEDEAWKAFVEAAELSRLRAWCTQHCPPDHEDEAFWAGIPTLGSPGVGLWTFLLNNPGGMFPLFYPWWTSPQVD